MEKNTVFFSHTSKDKEVVLFIQRRINEITGNSINIFMSSDGQSIPFGSNWVHKVEEGLSLATIMFVFVTPASMKSGWIYFEAGFAYSKGIEVIPVGINTDIGNLRAPLSLLQGFNVTSADSLNNFVSVINKKYDCTFGESFTDEDFQNILSLNNYESVQLFQVESIASFADFHISSEYKKTDGTTKEFDLDKIYKRIIEFLESKGVQYAKAHNYYSSDASQEIITNGIRIKYKPKPKNHDAFNRGANERGEIMLRMSPYNFVNSFEAFNDILMSIVDLYDDNAYIDFHLNKDIRCLIKDEDTSSIISQYPEVFDIHKEDSNEYTYRPRNLTFGFFGNGDSWPRNSKVTEYVLFVCFKKGETKANQIIELIEELIAIKLLRFNSSNVGTVPKE